MLAKFKLDKFEEGQKSDKIKDILIEIEKKMIENEQTGEMRWNQIDIRIAQIVENESKNLEKFIANRVEEKGKYVQIEDKVTEIQKKMVENDQRVEMR